MFMAGAVQAQGADAVYFGDGFAEAGDTVDLPIVVLDKSLTAIGADSGAGRRIQNLSISATVTPADKVTGVTFKRAGITTGLTPLFETQVTDATQPLTSWILSFDEANQPIPFSLDQGDLVGYLEVTLTAQATPGDVIQLEFDAARSALANQGGVLTATGANSGLVLLDGTLRVEAPPIFVDGFETGDTGQWDLAVP